MLDVNDKVVISNIMRIKPALKALISNIFPIFYIGRFGDETTLFSLARQLEQARLWFGKRPPSLC